MVEDAHRALADEHEWRTPLVRAGALTRLARAVEEPSGQARRARDPRHRQAALAVQGRRAGHDPLPRVLRGLDRAPRRPPDPARPGRARLHGARAVGRVRADHPLELPAAGHRALRRARARGGQRGDPQAVRAGLDHAAALRADRRGGGRPARGCSTSRPATAAPATRSCATPAWITSRSSAPPPPARRSPRRARAGSSRSSSSWAASPRTSSSRTPTSSKAVPAIVNGAAPERGPELLGGLAAAGGEDAVRRGHGARRGRVRGRQDRPRRRGPGPRPADLRAPARTRHLDARARARPAARACSAARRTGLFMQPALVTRVTLDMEIFHEEVFGPVLVAVPFEDERHAVQVANATRLRARRGRVDPRPRPRAPGRLGHPRRAGIRQRLRCRRRRGAALRRDGAERDTAAARASTRCSPIARQKTCGSR